MSNIFGILPGYLRLLNSLAQMRTHSKTKPSASQELVSPDSPHNLPLAPAPNRDGHTPPPKLPDQRRLSTPFGRAVEATSPTIGKSVAGKLISWTNADVAADRRRVSDVRQHGPPQTRNQSAWNSRVMGSMSISANGGAARWSPRPRWSREQDVFDGGEVPVLHREMMDFLVVQLETVC